jgi:soluble lytic murein transglycosylase
MIRRRGDPVLLALLAMFPAGGPAGEEIYYRRDDNGALVLTNVPDHGGLKTFAGRGLPGLHSGKEYQDLIHATAMRHGVHPDLVTAVIAVESNFNPRAVSVKGAQGLMQLMPDTARRFGVRDPFDPADNLLGGVRYLRHLLDLFEGDLRLALAAYNAGETIVAQLRGIPPYRETRGYVTKVLRLFGPRQPYAARPPGRTAAAPRPVPAAIHSYTDADGVRRFSDTPPPPERERGAGSSAPH